MKSLIEEASSIAKAIERAWERAGKPNSFSVKIYELPEKNFIGFTSRYAKVGLFFDQESSQGQGSISGAKKDNNQTSRSNNKQQDRPPLKSPNALSTKRNKPSGDVEIRSVKEGAKKSEKQNNVGPVPIVVKQKTKDVQHKDPLIVTNKSWSDEMLAMVQTWTRSVLDLLNLPDVLFTVNVNQSMLTVNFDTPLIGNELKESLLYRKLAYLLLTALRNQFKDDFKSLKLTLTRE